MVMTKKASLACEVRASIRCEPVLSYEIIADLFRRKIELKEPYFRYLYGFFEECYPALIKKFMAEQNLSKEQILALFHRLPERGEKRKFQEALTHGSF